MMPQILQQLGGGLQISPQVRQMITLIKTAGNPQMMLNQLLQTNPQLGQVMKIVEQYGGDANRALREIAEQNGINPEEIFSLIR